MHMNFCFQYKWTFVFNCRGLPNDNPISKGCTGILIFNYNMFICKNIYLHHFSLPFPHNPSHLPIYLHLLSQIHCFYIFNFCVHTYTHICTYMCTYTYVCIHMSVCILYHINIKCSVCILLLICVWFPGWSVSVR